MDLETKVAPIIRSICDSYQMPNGDEYDYLINYIALLFVRTPSSKKKFESLRERLMKITMNMALVTENQYNDIRKKLDEQGEEIPDITYEQLRSFAEEGNYRISIHNNTQMQDMIDAMDTILQPLASRNWTIAISPNTVGDFICSDNPARLNWINNSNPSSLDSPGHGRMGTEVTIPLSSRVMLIGRFESNLPDSVKLISRLNLALLNSHTSRNSRFIYSRNKKFIWYSCENKIADTNDFKRLIHKHNQK